MAKVTTIIDIGSNSMRMITFKKTSRFGFYTINETKTKVKISENSYKENGNLQPEAMTRTFDALKSFLNIAKNLKSRKILCIATSALRDAPNKKIFINKVAKELKLNIKVIDGIKESFYGGIAALNLLDCDDFTTLDIGGGSTELSFISENNIKNNFSLQIGTVRIQEIYLDKKDTKGAKEYIESILDQTKLKKTSLIRQIVGLGGSIRALSKIIMLQEKYPLENPHGFEYNYHEYNELFNQIINAKNEKILSKIGISKDRYDTIISGTFIFKTIVEYFNVDKIITCSAGIREGVYLYDMLRTSNYKFPSNFNISIKSFLDKFDTHSQQSKYLGNNAKNIFDILQPSHKLNNKYKNILIFASKLQSVAFSLNFNKNKEHIFWHIINNLQYGFNHSDKVLIAMILKQQKNNLIIKNDIKVFQNLLPNIKTIQWLSLMLRLNNALNIELNKAKYIYILENNILQIHSKNEQYLIKEELEKINFLPMNISISYCNDN